MYTILLVEDEAIELLSLKYAIQSNYENVFHLLEATDGHTAFGLYETYHPEIMIIDINIPGISGLDLIRKINPRESGVKILITTAYDKSAYIRKALELGVLHYLLKPIDVTELHADIDHCLTELKEHMQQREQLHSLIHGIESVRSYAKEYLVQDILCGSAPAEVLRNACGWPANGNLQICIFCWRPEKEPDFDFFYRLCMEYFQACFSILFSPVEGYGLLFLQTHKHEEAHAMTLLLHTVSRPLLASLGHGRITASPFYTTYEDVAQAWKKLRTELYLQTLPVVLPPLPMQSLGNTHKRILLRQKMLRMLRERQLGPLSTILKKYLSDSTTYWQGAALFLDALSRFDNSIPLSQPLSIFFQKNAPALLNKWLSEYYQTHQSSFSEDTGGSSYIDNALALIHQNFNCDLTLTSVAEELGLSAPYFSNLFKQQTGENFITYLNNLRISHALTLLNQSEYDLDTIAHQCGYYSKKYFLETFKRITGQSVTQYREKAGRNHEIRFLTPENIPDYQSQSDLHFADQLCISDDQ